MLTSDLEHGVADDSVYERPGFGERGRILFRLALTPNEPYEVQTLDYDVDSSVVFLSMGLGCEEFLTRKVDLDLELDGVYVMEGVSAESIKDVWGDFAEYWNFDSIRRASPAEEASEMLDGEWT
jgi:hypothetical protein